MDKLTQKVITNINKRVECARCNWDSDFDDSNTINDWTAYIIRYASEATNFKLTTEEQKEKLEKAAGLVVSALVALERNGKFADRHYD